MILGPVSFLLPRYPNSDYMRQKLSLAGSSIGLRRPTAASRSSANDPAILSGTGLTDAFTRSKVLKQTLENCPRLLMMAGLLLMHHLAGEKWAVIHTKRHVGFPFSFLSGFVTFVPLIGGQLVVGVSTAEVGKGCRLISMEALQGTRCMLGLWS